MLTRLQQISHQITGEHLELIEFARKLRDEATDAEAFLWACLRDRRVNQRKFRRQHPVAPYVLDFYCAQLRLAIELDGGQHNSPEGKARDAAREAFLQTKGIQTLRFTNHEMLKETESVLNVIWDRTRRVADSEKALPASASANGPNANSLSPPQTSQHADVLRGEDR